MANENTSKLVTLGEGSLGKIKVADEVVAVIAALAANEVEGVAAMAGNITSSIMSGVGMKSLSKGVRVYVDGLQVRVELALIILYGYSVAAVGSRVQDRVKTAVENMTGMKVTDVNVRIAGVITKKSGETK